MIRVSETRAVVWLTATVGCSLLLIGFVYSKLLMDPYMVRRGGPICGD